MDKPIVACIQHRLIAPRTADEYDAHLNRFLRTAKAKGAKLALFPELSGIATAIPTFTGWRNNLLVTAEQGKQPRAGLWQRTKSKLAGGAASVVRADLRKTLIQALQDMPESLEDAYIAGFASLAQRYEMTLVAGSLYERNPESGDIENVSLVFGPDGSLLGRQAKVILSQNDREISQPSGGWGVIPTPAGRVGILLGNDILYPEPARILAYQGADMLLTMGAVTKPATYHKIRQAASARCQENQLYGMVSFLVGADPFAPADAPPFIGKSAIFAPLEFTPRFTGVMVEVGSPLAEGVITAEWDYPALEQLWEEGDTPLRREMPLLQAGPILANVYGRALPLAQNKQLMLEAATEPEVSEQLAVISDQSETETTEMVTEDRSPITDSRPKLTPILPESYAFSPEELDAAAEAIAGRTEDHARNVGAAAAEVRDAIAQASAQVRSAANDAPEQIDAKIEHVVAETAQALDDSITVEPATGAGDEIVAETQIFAPDAPAAELETGVAPAPDLTPDADLDPVPDLLPDLEFHHLPDALSGETPDPEPAPAPPLWSDPEPEPAPESAPRRFRWPWKRG